MHAPVFVLLEGPDLGNDRATQFKIRSKAAQIGAVKRARPKKRTQMKKDRTPVTDHHEKSTLDLNFLSKTVSLSGYEAARSKFGVDITHLSALIDCSICSITTSASSWLATVLDSTRWSYLQFIPSRYGLTAGLTKATDALMYRMHEVLIPGQRIAGFRLYADALTSLQTALADPQASNTSDTLCAVQFLGLYTMLDSVDVSWSYHVKGCARLITLRRPESFHDEFDRALFASNVEPMMFFAAATNTHCYLEEDEWLNVLRTGEETWRLTPRSPLALNTRALKVKTVGLWIDYREIVPSDRFSSNVHDLCARTEKLHTEATKVLDAYTDHCQTSSDSIDVQEIATRREVLGTALSCALIVKKLLTTVCEDTDQRRTLGDDLHNLADALIAMQGTSGLLNKHELAFANGILKTEQVEGTNDELGNRRARYMAWVDAVLSDMPTMPKKPKMKQAAMT